MHKRIIISGPTASGKTLLKKRFENKNFKFDISYTSRSKRPNETDGVDYVFLTKKDFKEKIKNDFFYEWVEYNGYFYGTGLEEWNTSDGFVMETDGIKNIKPEDRKNCFIMYLNISYQIRLDRMQTERNWDLERAIKRQRTDFKKFDYFTDYDMVITNPNF